MGYYIECFKSYTFERNIHNEDVFKMIGSKNATYISPSTLTDIDDYLEQYNLHMKWRTIIPIFYGMCFECLTDNESNYIKDNIIEPSKCLIMMEELNLTKKLEIDQPKGYKKMLEMIKSLIKYWKDGYYIIKRY